MIPGAVDISRQLLALGRSLINKRTRNICQDHLTNLCCGIDPKYNFYKNRPTGTSYPHRSSV
jgi:hypothetical protein